MNHLPTLSLLPALLAPALVCASALPGHLDPSFGEGGVAIVSESRPVGYADANDGVEQFLVELPTGELLVVANMVVLPGQGTRPELVKLTAQGNAVETFGEGGIARPTFEGISDFIGGDAVADDEGRILVAAKVLRNGSATTGIAVCRLLQDGSVDTTFGEEPTPGCAVRHFTGANTVGNALLVQACQPADGCVDGKRIVVAGAVVATTGTKKKAGVAVAWHYDGSGIDVSFNGGGVTSMDAKDDRHTEFTAIAQNHSGALALAGNVKNIAGDLDMFVVRLTPSGAFQEGFGLKPGYRVVQFDAGLPDAREENARDVHLAEDGSVLVAGFAETAVDRTSPAAARMLSNGVFDPTFDGGIVVDPGKLVFDICEGDGQCKTGAHEMALLPDGKIVLAVDAALDPEGVHNGLSRMAALRLRQDGTPDASFRSPASTLGGLAVFDLHAIAPGTETLPDDAATQVLLQGENVVLAGYVRTGYAVPNVDAGYDLVLARLGNGEAPLFADGFEEP